MKIYFSYISIIVFAIAMSSCLKEGPKEESEQTFPYGYFSAETVDETSRTKTFLEGMTVNWTAGDVVRITSDFSAFVNGTASVSGQNTKLSLSAPVAESSDYYAVFPSAVSPLGGGEEILSEILAGEAPYSVKFVPTIFPVQRAVIGSFDSSRIPMGAYSASDRNFHFVNLASLVKFTLTGSEIAKVVIEDASGKTDLAGSFFISGRDTDNDKCLDDFIIEDDPEKKNCSTSVTLLPPVGETSFPEGTYYAAVRPGVTSSEGLVIKVYDAAGSLINGVASRVSLTFNRGKIRNIGNVSVVRQLSTFAGIVGTAGNNDGKQGVGKLNAPEGIIKASDGSMYVLQRAGIHAVRKLSTEGTLSTLATAKQFPVISFPWNGAVDSEDNLFFASKGNSKLLFYEKLSGNVSEIAVTGGNLDNPMDVAINSYGEVFVASRNNNKIFKLSVDKSAKTAQTLATYEVKFPSSICLDKYDNLYVASTTGGYITRISPAGDLSHIVGNGTVKENYFSGNDGDLLGKPVLDAINGLHIGADGCLYFTETSGKKYVKKLIPAKGRDYSHGVIHTIATGFYASELSTNSDCSKIFISSATTHSIRVIDNVAAKAYDTMLGRLQACHILKDVSKTEEINICPGVERQSFIAKFASDSKLTAIHVIKANTKESGVKIQLVLPKDPSTAEFSKSSMRAMASTIDTKDAEVVAMTPADYFGRENAPVVPRGPVIFNNNVYRDEWFDNNSYSFVAIRNDGSMYIGSRDEYDSMTEAQKKSYKYLCGGHMPIVDKGFAVPYTNSRTGFNAMAYDLDGNIYMMIVESNSTYAGANWNEAGAIMCSLGCYMATTQQTGSHAMALAMNPATHSREIVNSALSKGETSVVGAWAVTYPRSSAYPSDIQSAIAACPAVRSLSNWTYSFLSPNIKYYTGTLNLSEKNGLKTNIHLLHTKTNQSGVKVNSIYVNASTDEIMTPELQNLAEMAAKATVKIGKRVRSISTGDMFDNDSNSPYYKWTRGPLHSQGHILNSSWKVNPAFPQQALGFIGIKTDKSVKIGTREDYENMTSAQREEYTDLQGTGVILLKDGIGYQAHSMANNWGMQRDPRAAIGYNSSTHDFYVLIGDGRNVGVSEGLTYSEMTEIFRWLGCDSAVNQDGGASAQMYHFNGSRYLLKNEPRSTEEGNPIVNRDLAVAWTLSE